MKSTNRLGARAVAVGVTLEEAVAALQAAVVARAELPPTARAALPPAAQVVARLGDVELDIREAEVTRSQDAVDVTAFGDTGRRCVAGLGRTEVRLVVLGDVPSPMFLGAPLSVNVAGYHFQVLVTRADTRLAVGALVETTLYGVSTGLVEHVTVDADAVVAAVDPSLPRAISLDGVPCQR